jgi:CheY-like chemotaxis protein
LRNILEDEGYTVCEAQDGQMALDLLQQTTEGWVVLTDHLMRSLNGPGLIAAVLAAPELHTRHAFIYMTAVDRYLAPDLQLMLDALHAPILRKPFSLEVCPATVASAVKRLADTMA